MVQTVGTARLFGTCFLQTGNTVCVECLIGKQKKPILFKVTEPEFHTVQSRTPIVPQSIADIPFCTGRKYHRQNSTSLCGTKFIIRRFQTVTVVCERLSSREFRREAAFCSHITFTTVTPKEN